MIGQRYVCDRFRESGCLGLQPKVGGKLHPRLNIDTKPIANKYCEGKLKRTLKRELKVRETANGEAEGSVEIEQVGRFNLTSCESGIGVVSFA